MKLALFDLNNRQFSGFHPLIVEVLRDATPAKESLLCGLFVLR